MFTELFFSHNFNMNKVNLHAKFNAYTLLSFLDTDHYKWLYGPNKLSGLSRNAPQEHLPATTEWNSWVISNYGCANVQW